MLFPDGQAGKGSNGGFSIFIFDGSHYYITLGFGLVRDLWSGGDWGWRSARFFLFHDGPVFVPSHGGLWGLSMFVWD